MNFMSGQLTHVDSCQAHEGLYGHNIQRPSEAFVSSGRPPEDWPNWDASVA